VALQWRYESRPELGILALSGMLDAQDAGRLYGAIGWTLYHGSGPLILDLAAVSRWTTVGQDSLIKSARRLAEAQRSLEVAARPAGGPDLISSCEHPVIRVHTDLTSAMSAHGAPADPDGKVRQWRSDDWPEAKARR
jgi:hypothetical protein